jgi:hypothetical protein
VPERERCREAAGAHPEYVQVRAGRDLPDDVGGAQLRGDVVVQRPPSVVGLVLPGIAPHDAEGMNALANGVLDEAAPRRQVEEVVLVDLRRHDKQRPAADLRGARRVLENLEHLLPVHHRAGAAGKVFADVERPGVDLGREPAIQHEITGHVAESAHQGSAAGVERSLQRRGLPDSTFVGAAAPVRIRVR